MVNDPNLINYAQTIDLLNRRVTGLITNYNHLKIEYDHIRLSMKEIEDKINKLEKENKDLHSAITHIERCEKINGD